MNQAQDIFPSPSALCLRRHCHGFSLIELLVVLGIIAVVVSILIPVVGQVRRAADQTVCVSNLGHVGSAILAYLAANDGSFPVHRIDDYVPGRTGERYWATTILPYCANKQALFHCPAIPQDGVGNYSAIRGAMWTWSWAFDQYNIGYGYNGWFLAIRLYADQSLLGITTHYPVYLRQVKKPSMCLLVADTAAPWAQSIWWPNSGGSDGEGLVDRHPAGAGAVFCDGHAEVRLASTINPPRSVYTGDKTNLEYWDPLQRH